MPRGTVALRRAVGARPLAALHRQLSAAGSPPEEPSKPSQGMLGRFADSARTLLPTQTAVRKAAVEKMNKGLESNKGWRAALEDGVASHQQAKRDEFVRDSMRELGKSPAFGFDQLRENYQRALDEIENQGLMAKGRLWADKMTGGDTADNIERQKKDTTAKIAIIDELTVHERRRPKLLDRKARAEIARKLAPVGVGAELVDTLLLEFELQRAQWGFLRREFLRGRRLPTTNEELQWRIKNRPTREYMHVMKRLQKEKLAKERQELSPDEELKKRRKERKRRKHFISSVYEQLGGDSA